MATPKNTKAKQDKPAEEPKAKETTLVAVRNKARFDYVQPSTQIKVRTGEVTDVRDDCWLDQFVKAGLLERV